MIYNYLECNNGISNAGFATQRLQSLAKTEKLLQVYLSAVINDQNITHFRLEIFYAVIFLLIIAVLFTERFITYARFKEHTGYPQLLG